ncbi:MAG: hypothetical protein QXO27_03560 [Candidatus Aenigmatarchaeota archaeon]
MKPYIKKFCKISNFTVWIVDGKYIRKHIDKEFTNFGQHFRFKFIPENEFWIDKKYGDKGEEQYFIEHMLIEHNLMKEGKSYDEAAKEALTVVSQKRNESLKTRDKEDILKKVYKRLLKTYSKNIKVWIVNGKLVRDIFYADFTQGGHDKVFSFIPKGEVWIDDDVSQKERKFIILHELYERFLMSNGWDYDGRKKSAHDQSNEIEFLCRHNPEYIDKILKIEVLRNC